MLQTNLPFPVRRGKVRDVYDLGEQILIVATDRISAFDVIMPDAIPDKGKILTALSLFWFEKFGDQFQNHLITADVTKFPPPLAGFADQLAGRSMLVTKATVIPIECVARGYLAGSGWKEYRDTQQVCGVKLPPGLKQCDKLPAPIFSPATKADAGHDENISFDQMVEKVGAKLADDLRERTLRLYTLASDYARTRGIIIADTKLEFGFPTTPVAVRPDGAWDLQLDPVAQRPAYPILIDEILTPDSSRFWPARDYQSGHDQPSFDKQFLRNWLEKQTWNKQPPAPKLPQDVIDGTRARYLDAYRMLTGRDLAL